MLKTKCKCGRWHEYSKANEGLPCKICRIGEDPEYAMRMGESGFDPVQYEADCKLLNPMPNAQLDLETQESDMGDGGGSKEEGEWHEEPKIKIGEPENNSKIRKRKPADPRRRDSIISLLKSTSDRVDVKWMTEKLGIKSFALNPGGAWRKALDELVAQGVVCIGFDKGKSGKKKTVYMLPGGAPIAKATKIKSELELPEEFKRGVLENLEKVRALKREKEVKAVGFAGGVDGAESIEIRVRDVLITIQFPTITQKIIK